MARGQIIATAPNGTSGAQLVAPTTGDAANGHYVVNTGSSRVHVKNTNGASTARTVTFNFATKVDGQSIAAKTKSIAAGATWVFGPFPIDKYGDQLNIDVDNAELTIHVVE